VLLKWKEITIIMFIFVTSKMRSNRAEGSIGESNGIDIKTRSE